MKLTQLVLAIESAHRTLRTRAAQSVNTALTIRNWMIGFYIVEFEQKGEDRAEYGDRLLETLTAKLRARAVPGVSKTALILFREFYKAYPQIRQTLTDHFNISLDRSLHVAPAKSKTRAIDQTVPDPLSVPPIQLLEHLSFSHFVELLKVKDLVKQSFYETQAIKAHWSIRELKRQMGSFLYERLAKSKDKTKLIKGIRGEILTPDEAIKNPYVFEFLNIPDKAAYSESDLESALIRHLHDFLLELGKGFCFEARQKRLTINNQHYFIDLLFYHRILKCHILIELKIREFSHTDAGQMNFYLNYMRENEMNPGDNPPIGIILCTHDEEAEVKYATVGMDNKLFVSRYMLQLPTPQELKKFLRQDVRLLEERNVR